jgi:hypothetical protein
MGRTVTNDPEQAQLLNKGKGQITMTSISGKSLSNVSKN